MPELPALHLETKPRESHPFLLQAGGEGRPQLPPYKHTRAKSIPQGHPSATSSHRQRPRGGAAGDWPWPHAPSMGPAPPPPGAGSLPPPWAHCSSPRPPLLGCSRLLPLDTQCPVYPAEDTALCPADTAPQVPKSPTFVPWPRDLLGSVGPRNQEPNGEELAHPPGSASTKLLTTFMRSLLEAVGTEEEGEASLDRGSALLCICSDMRPTWMLFSRRELSGRESGLEVTGGAAAAP